MGYTSFIIGNIEKHLDNVKCVLDYGAQNDYSKPETPYISEYYLKKGIEYTCIDLNGENGAIVQDLTEEFDLGRKFDLVVDAGTIEHTSDLYMSFLNLFRHCKTGGLIYRENPKTGSWPGHGVNYMTEDFYIGLEKIADIEIFMLGSHPAMGNYTNDGWDVYCLIIKRGDGFPTREAFEKLDLRPE